MAERRSARLRVLFIVLAVANVLVFAFLRVRTGPHEAASTRIQEVQINAGTVKLLGATTRGAGQGAENPAPNSVASAACIEWSPISGENVPAAESALDKLALARPPVRRALPEASGAERYAYFVQEPETGTVGQMAELQRLFPGTQISATKCPEDVAASPGSGEQTR
jgi:hypothetical protein